MVAPVVIGAGISAIGSLLGGIFGRNSERKAIAAQNAYNDPAAVRRRFEAAGFNPLLGIQPGVGMQAATGGTNYIGAGISDAISSVASAWSENATQKAEAEALEAENEKLRRQVQVETIRPKMGGLYSGAKGLSIGIRNDGWQKEWDADYAGKEVRQMPGTSGYEARNNARTVIRTPFADTTPADISDAEDWEMRYGDPVSWAVGLGTLAADAGASLRSYTNKKGWTDPNKWVGQDTFESIFKGAKETVGIPEPTGYTEAGNPFWVQKDGSVKWRYDK